MPFEEIDVVSFIPTMITGLYATLTVLVLLPAVINGLRRNIFQSSARLVFTILTMVSAGALAYFFTPTLFQTILTNIEIEDGGAVQELVEYLVGGSVAANDALAIFGSIVTPFIFLALFVVLDVILVIVYGILSLTVLKALGKKVFSETESGKGGVGPRLGAVLIEIFSGVLIVSCLTMPMSYSVHLVSDSLKTEEVQKLFERIEESEELNYDAITPYVLGEDIGLDGSDGFDEEWVELDFKTLILNVQAVTDAIVSDPFDVVYYTFGRIPAQILTTLHTDSGEKVSQKEFLGHIIGISNALMDNLDEQGFTSATCYALADKIELDPMLDEFLGGIFSDAGNAWLNEKTFIGLDASFVMDNIQMDGIDVRSMAKQFYGILAKNHSAAVELRGIASAINIAEMVTIDASDSEARQDSIYQLLTAPNEESKEVTLAIIDTLFDTVLKDSGIPGAEELNIDAYKPFVESIFKGSSAINNDVTLTPEQKAEKLATEAECLSSIMDVAMGAISDPDAFEPETIVELAVRSEILSSAIIAMTDGGKINDPMSISGALGEGVLDEAKGYLDKYGVEKGSDLYNALLAFVSQGE